LNQKLKNCSRLSYCLFNHVTLTRTSSEIKEIIKNT